MTSPFPDSWPRTGIGEVEASARVSDAIRKGSAKLGAKTALAHMDPPTPKIAKDIVALNAAFNQNLLHPDLSPFATRVEKLVMRWIAPEFGMSWGLMCAGSTLGNLNALWAAREAGCRRVVHSEDAHLSVKKCAHILGMDATEIGTNAAGQIQTSRLPDIAESVLVVTAGTTGRGAIDPIQRSGALWLHVDAAWAGPLRFTKYADRLGGIEDADSVSISAHKWLYQPKDSAFVLFKDIAAKASIAAGGAYLTTPNIGVQGSRSANALPLFATLLAWGRDGLAERIEGDMARADSLSNWIAAHPALELKVRHETGVINWRPTSGVNDAFAQLLQGPCSTTMIDGERWMRNVTANPNADVSAITALIDVAIDSQGTPS